MTGLLEIDNVVFMRSRTGVCGSCGYRQDVGYAA